MVESLEIEWLGSVAYSEGLALQDEAVARRRSGASGDRLLLLEHPPVLTLGRGATEDHIRVSPEELDARGIEVHRVSRGGEVTYHAPGQLVGYLVMDLEARGEADIHRFLRDIEDCLGRAISDLGLEPRTIAGYTGLFVAGRGTPRKIASIGVGLRGWITHHGFALNVDLDLAGFDSIVPCGLDDVVMTSVARELGESAVDLGPRARAAVERACQERWG